MALTNLTSLINALYAETQQDSITPALLRYDHKRHSAT